VTTRSTGWRPACGIRIERAAGPALGDLDLERDRVIVSQQWTEGDLLAFLETGECVFSTSKRT
jgi:hypothetical protein